MDLATVLKIENDFANDTASPISRNCGLEVKLAMGAVGARKRAGNCAVKWFRTFRTERRPNSRNLRFPPSTKIFAIIDRRGADGARRWIKQRDDAAKKIRRRDHRHISTSSALATTSSTRLRVGQFQRTDSCRAGAMQ